MIMLRAFDKVIVELNVDRRHRYNMMSYIEFIMRFIFLMEVIHKLYSMFVENYDYDSIMHRYIFFFLFYIEEYPTVYTREFIRHL